MRGATLICAELGLDSTSVRTRAVEKRYRPISRRIRRFPWHPLRAADGDGAFRSLALPLSSSPPRAGAGGGGGDGGDAGDGGGDGEATTITVATVANPQMQDIEELISNFEEENPDITVNFSILPENELRDKVTQDIATRRANTTL